jgi:hypothetical protein
MLTYADVCLRQVRGKMGVGVFLWDASDRVVVADMEAVIGK